MCNQLDENIDSILVSSVEQSDIEDSNLEIDFPSTKLAYLIYTSGSTGNPKGVMIEHRNVINFIHGVCEKISFPESSRFLCLTTYSFDIFVLETFLPLLKGMEVVLASSLQQKDPDLLAQLIKQQKANVMQITPSHLKLFLLHTSFRDCLKNIKVLMIGGEALPRELLYELKKYYKGTIYNMYGPTETTVWSTIKDVTSSNQITIGTPIANTQIRIINKYGMLQPINVPGELCIGGDGVGRGYFGNEKLTKEKFIDDTVNRQKRFYRTGDMAKWLPDGTIEFIGRIDDQIKLNGFRIELGEVEYHMSNYDGINEAVIMRKEEERNSFLVAYYISNSKNNIEVIDLRNFLSKKLPNYMIPSFFIKVDSFSLTPNGKINKKKLPWLVKRDNDNTNHTEPENKEEKELLIAWKEVLKITDIDTDIDFFQAGGTSLQLIILFKMLEERFPGKIQMMDMFENNSIKSMAKYIKGKEDKQSVISKQKIKKVIF